MNNKTTAAKVYMLGRELPTDQFTFDGGSGTLTLSEDVRELSKLYKKVFGEGIPFQISYGYNAEQITDDQ